MILSSHGQKRNHRPKIAICHPRIGWGGSERKVFWGIESLKKAYQVSLITAGRFDLGEMNRYHGTSLESSDFHICQVPLPRLLRDNATAAAIRYALYQRYCRRQATFYDGMISAYGPCDFGVSAIYYVSDFAWSDKIRESLHPAHPGLFYRKHLLRTLYLLMARQLHYPSGRPLFTPDDKVISVSGWVADILTQQFNVDSEIIYPPIPGRFPRVPDTQKEDGFICLGRMAPEKRIEEIIEILEKVRRWHPELHLHIIGHLNNDRYGREINGRIHENREWIRYEGRKVGKEKRNLLAIHRFGIHACRGDAYPGAVAEMIKAGCMVFAHRLGGQNEIIEHPALMFDSVSDAVKKIRNILRNKLLQRDLKMHLNGKGAALSTESFMARFKRAVDRFMVSRS